MPQMPSHAPHLAIIGLINSPQRPTAMDLPACLLNNSSFPFDNSRMLRSPIALAVLVLCHGLVAAQSAAVETQALDTVSAKPVQPADKIQSVEVKGTAENYDPRRDDTASKTVLRSEEIMKYGDTNVFDVLKRAPGVTVVNNSIRMRGLGSGYTQILVNGERAPPGFSMDTLTPDQIERIEIIRSATAEYSMQAIAGTVNIVLRKVVAKTQRDVQLLRNHSSQNDTAMANAQFADKRGSLSYFLSANASSSHYHSFSVESDRYFTPDGMQTKGQNSVYRFARESDALNLSARLNWKLANGDDFSVQLRAQDERSRAPGEGVADAYLGQFSDPNYVEYKGVNPGERRTLSGDINWVAKIAGGKLDVKVNTHFAHIDNDSEGLSSTAGRVHSLLQVWDSTTRSQQNGVNVKFGRALFDGHALSTGIELSRQRNDEARDRKDTFDAAPVQRVIERFEPAVTRLAGYLQDEWNVTPQWSIYLGARWEQIRTDSASTSTATGASSLSSRNQVLSPVAQTLYKFPDKSGRQLRLALTRTFKAPTIDQLTARRNEAINNTQFAPDWGGNPDLRPELATGVDLTYEHFWKPGAMVSLSASVREIDDYIRTRLEQDANGRWVYRPVNSGNAGVRSLEAELKFPLRTFFATAPALELRFNAARNWSSVDSVPGSNNRLDAQTPLSGTAGIDYKEGALTTGANVSYRKGGWVRISAQQSQLMDSRTDVQAYAAWKFNPRYQVRTSLSNLLRQDFHNHREYADANGRRITESMNPSSTTVTLSVEMKY